mgnify:CR=1 FL=1
MIADVVLLGLEDGDRTEALVRMGKRVIAIDLNPLSRTARAATVTIVDNVVRAFPLLVKYAREMKNLSREELEGVVARYDNRAVLASALRFMAQRLMELSRQLAQ